MGYRVWVIGEHDLPEGLGWALIEVDAATTIFAVKESAFSPTTIADGWAAYRKLQRGDKRQRPPGEGGQVLHLLQPA